MNYVEIVKNEKHLMVLVGSAVLFLLSLFLIPILPLMVFATTFTLFVVSVFFSMFRLFGFSVLFELAKNSSEVSEESLKEKKYFKASIYLLVIPMLMIAFVMIIFQLIAMYSML